MVGGAPSIVVTFPSTHDALAAEGKLTEAGVSGRLIPTPVVVTSDCGLAWRSPREERYALMAVLEGLAYEDVLELML